jgi:hypothetical protein
MSTSFFQLESDDNGSVRYSSRINLWHPTLDCAVVLFMGREPPVGQNLLIHEVSRSHTTTHHSKTPPDE